MELQTRINIPSQFYFEYSSNFENYSNTAAFSDQLVSEPEFSRDEMFQFQVVSSIDFILISELQQIAEVDAIFAERDSEGLLMVFVVTREHTENIHERVLLAEDRIVVQLGGDKIELRIRAHQGRRPCRAVPIGSLPIYQR